MRPYTTLLFSVCTLMIFGQTPKNLVGLQYVGTSKAEFQEGCEGCGNPGHIEFRKDGFVEFTLPGSDTGGSTRYKRSGNTIHFQDSKWTMVLKGDSLFFTAYDYRHVYLRER